MTVFAGLFRRFPSPARGLGAAIAAAFVLVFGATNAAHAQPQTQQTQSRGVPVQEVVSPNGIRAWLVSDSTVPMIVLNAYWKGGSALEDMRMTGVTSVMTDMLSEGAGDMDANAFKVRLEELNMQLGFSSTWDGVSMALVTLTDNRDAAFEMARLALMSPRFDAAPLERMKRQLAVAIRQRETNPSYIANLALDQALIPDHPYARRSTLENVAAINRAALVNTRAHLFKKARLQITVVGDIDAATLGPLLDRTFGALPQGESAPPVPMANIRAPSPLIVRQLPQPQSLILFSAPGVDDQDPDWLPLAVANYILGGGGFSSRLMDEVREERGLVYGISTSNSVRDGAAFVRGIAQTRNESVGQAIETTRAEIGRLYRDGPTQAEVDDAIRYLTGSFALDLDSNVKIANVLFSYQTTGRPIDYINRRNDLIRAVTREDVIRVIRRLYDPAKFTFVAVGQPNIAAAAAPPAAAR